MYFIECANEQALASLVVDDLDHLVNEVENRRPVVRLLERERAMFEKGGAQILPAG